MARKVPQRNEVEDQYKWQLNHIFESDAQWEDGFLEVKNSLEALAAYQVELQHSSAKLFEFIRLMHDKEELLGKLFAYAHMKNDEDKSVPKYQEIYERCAMLLSNFNEAVSFFEPLLLQQDDEKILALAETDENNLYRHFLHNILRTRPHLLSASGERLLAMSAEISQAPAEVFGVWDSVDIQFPQMKDENGKMVTISNGLYGKYQQSADRRLRRDSYMGLYKPFIEHRNMLATNFAAIIKSHIFHSRARNYDSTLDAALDANAVPSSVYHNLIDTTHGHLQPLQRYNELRRELLKLSDGVHDYDLRAPLFSGKEKEYTWEQAKLLCYEGTAPLGPEYQQIIEQSFRDGWIDVYENQGKRTGAYSSGSYGIHPYVLMNYNGTMGDVFTLAHEMGHAMHTWYTIHNQPFVYGDYPIFLAEVASTTNEALLQQYLIDHAESRQLKLAYLNDYLDKFSQTFFRQVLFAEFELKTHEIIEQGGALTADRLDDLFGGLYETYHGPAFVLDRETKALWSRVPHFYYNYYVFQYATSFTASLALAGELLKGDTAIRDQYLRFLKSGNSAYPIETLQIAGVDMTSSKPVKLAMEYMTSLLDEMEALI